MDHVLTKNKNVRALLLEVLSVIVTRCGADLFVRVSNQETLWPQLSLQLTTLLQEEGDREEEEEDEEESDNHRSLKLALDILVGLSDVGDIARRLTAGNNVFLSALLSRIVSASSERRWEIGMTSLAILKNLLDHCGDALISQIADYSEQLSKLPFLLDVPFATDAHKTLLLQTLRAVATNEERALDAMMATSSLLRALVKIINSEDGTENGLITAALSWLQLIASLPCYRTTLTSTKMCACLMLLRLMERCNDRSRPLALAVFYELAGAEDTALAMMMSEDLALLPSIISLMVRSESTESVADVRFLSLRLFQRLIMTCGAVGLAILTTPKFGLFTALLTLLRSTRQLNIRQSTLQLLRVMTSSPTLEIEPVAPHELSQMMTGLASEIVEAKDTQDVEEGTILLQALFVLKNFLVMKPNMLVTLALGSREDEVGLLVRALRDVVLRRETGTALEGYVAQGSRHTLETELKLLSTETLQLLQRHMMASADAAIATATATATGGASHGF